MFGHFSILWMKELNGLNNNISMTRNMLIRPRQGKIIKGNSVYFTSVFDEDHNLTSETTYYIIFK